MSQAEELLNGIAVDDVVPASSPYVEVEPHIVIGLDRFIKVPDSLKRIAVQYDHNMRTVTFDCPRYYDGRDMSTMHVYINVMGPNRARYGYIADNVRVDDSDENMMHFDWTINRPMTDVKGSLAFLVCVRRADSEGNDVNHWNSELNTELYISEGMEYEETFENEYPDIVSQLLDRMDAVEAIATPEAMQGYTDAWLREKSDDIIAEVANKGVEVLESIPAEYTELHNYANEAARTKGDAVAYTVEGEVLSVADSSDDYLRGLRVFGKTAQVKTTGAQLLFVPDAASKTDRGLKQTIIGGTCIVKGTASSNASFNLTLAGAYTSTNPVLTLPAGTYTAQDCILSNYDGSTRKSYQGTFTLSADTPITWVATRSYGATEVVDETTYPMLNAGTEKLQWEPYTGGKPSPSPEYPQELVSVENTVVSVCGKNLIKPRGFSAYGYTVTVNDDGSFTVTGAANTTETLYLMVTPYSDVYPLRLQEGVDYFMWYESSNGKSIGTKNLDLNGDPVCSNIDTWNANVPHKCNRIVQIYLESKNHKIGDTSLCGTYKIQLEVGNKFTGFEGYKEVQELPTSRTLPGIPVSQNGNYTDADGRQWICDEIDFERGLYIQRVKTTVLNKTPTFNETADNPGRFSWYCLTDEYKHGREVCWCNYAAWRAWGIGDGTRDYGGLSINQIYYSPVKTMTAAEVNAKFAKMIADGNPPIVIGQLETPIETPLTATELAAFKYIHSNYPNTTVLNDAGAWMELKYNVDTELFIKNTLGKPTDEQVAAAIDNYVNEHGIATGATAEEKAQIELNKKDIGNLKTATQNAQTTANTAVTAAQNAQTTADAANQKVETLKGIVKGFHSNIVQETSGELIAVSDASDLELAGLRIFGKTEQKTTTGKNLLENTAVNNPGLYGIAFTVNADGSIKISGTATANASIKIGDITYEPGKTYIVSGNSGASSTTFALWSGGVGSIYNTDKTFTATEETKTELSLTVFKDANVNASVYPMIRLASVTDPTYEPYTGGIPSPNPDYPQELESVGNVTVGKNLWPHGDIPLASQLELELNLPVGKYVISRNDATSHLTFRFFTTPDLTDTDNSFLWTMDSGVKAQILTVNTTVYGCNTSVQSGNSSTDIQIEIGSVATTYEPYTIKGGMVNVTACGKNLLKPVSIGRFLDNQSQAFSYDGISWTLNHDGTINGNGKNTAAVGARTYCYIRPANITLNPGTYSFSDLTAVQFSDGSRFYSTFTLTERKILDLAYIEIPNQVSINTVYKPQIEVGSAITEYEPYKEPKTLPITTINADANLVKLPGIPVSSGGNYTDENGQQWICDYIDVAQGKYVQRVKKVVLTGEEVWTSSSLNAPYAISVDDIADCTDSDIRLLCDRYPAVNIADSWSKYDYLISRAAGNSKALQFRNVNISNLTKLKTTLTENPITVQYILAEENRIDLTTEELAAYTSKYGSNAMIYGKTIQPGTPSPDNPAPLINTSLVLRNAATGLTGLCGIPVASGGNYTDPITKQQWICDEVDFSTRQYVKRIGRVTLNGSEGWYQGSIPGASYLEIDDAVYASSSGIFALCSHYPWNGVGINAMHDGSFKLTSSSNGYEYLAVKDTSYPTVAEFQEYLSSNPMELVYILAKPVFYELLEEELAQYAALRTNYPNTTVFNDAGAHMDVKYIADTKIYIDNKFAELAAAIVGNA